MKGPAPRKTKRDPGMPHRHDEVKPRVTKKCQQGYHNGCDSLTCLCPCGHAVDEAGENAKVGSGF